MEYEVSGDAIKPRDGDLHCLAVEFCARELAHPIILHELRNAWVAAQVDDTGKPVKITGIGALIMRPDVCLLRFVDSKSGKVLMGRMNDFCADNGMRGQELLVFISSKEAQEQKCPAQAEWLEAMQCVPADRWSYTIK